LGFSKKQILLASGLLLLFLLAACTGQKNVPGPDTDLGGFLGGDSGLIIRILEGAPPKVIQDRGLTPFSFMITLENAGETKVGPGTDSPLLLARLVGVMNKDWGLTEESAVKTITTPLESAKRNIDGTITPGEMTEATFENLAYGPFVAESMAFTMRAEVCYDYESYATTQFCMKKDVVESSQDMTICMLKGPRPVGNSGAPLHVTAVEEAPLTPEKIQLNFRIEHTGRGVFFYRNVPKDNYDACVFSDLNPNIYKLEVVVDPVQQGMYSVECLRLDEQLPGGGVHGVVRMPFGAPLAITCFVTRTKETSQRVYTDLLNIKLRYRYGEFVEVPILVQGHP
jgi:hypothetical protein